MKYIIHRGVISNNIRENTYISIKKALQESNSSGVEFDIRLTKDNIIVLNHDSIFNNKIIERNNYSNLIKKEYLNTLDQILSIPSNKIFLIDIKVHNNYKRLANTLIKQINNTNKNIYLASFNKKIIKYIKKKTNYKVGYILYKYKPDLNSFVLLNYNLNKNINNTQDKEIFFWTINNIKNITLSNKDHIYYIIDKYI